MQKRPEIGSPQSILYTRLPRELRVSYAAMLFFPPANTSYPIYKKNQTVVDVQDQPYDGLPVFF